MFTQRVRYSTTDIRKKVRTLFAEDQEVVMRELAIHLLAHHIEPTPDTARARAKALCDGVATETVRLQFGGFYGLDSNDPQADLSLVGEHFTVSKLLAGIDESGKAYVQSCADGARRPDAINRLDQVPA